MGTYWRTSLTPTPGPGDDVSFSRLALRMAETTPFAMSSWMKHWDGSQTSVRPDIGAMKAHERRTTLLRAPMALSRSTTVGAMTAWDSRIDVVRGEILHQGKQG
jgi:hypothetical protein